MIRVVVVDDHSLVRAGLINLLESADDIDVVGETADGRQALDIVGSVRPDVVLMDLSMPVLDGVAATRLLLAADPEVVVVALTSFSERSQVQAVLSAGAVGYLLKDSAPRELLAAVRAAAAGHTPLDPRIAGLLLPARTPEPRSLLSDREAEVLTLAATGLANKQIGRRLGITEATVKAHLGSVFRRIGVSDRTSAAMWARDHLGVGGPAAAPALLTTRGRRSASSTRPTSSSSP